jgi:hypothetical protein
MIYHLVPREIYGSGITDYTRSWGKALSRLITPLSYKDLFKAKTLRVGTYIFSEINLLSRIDAGMAATVWEYLANAGYGIKLLNHPTRSMKRYELLRHLKEHGTNNFDVYQLTEVRSPQRFPVFLRYANEHTANITPLLHTRGELDNAIAEVSRQCKTREEVLIVEFCDTADERGIYRKYSAFIVGTRIIPHHIAFAKRWMVKGLELMEDDLLLEERHYVATNPHEDQLREIFALARIDYGRIDYAVLDGQLQVWEINTEPCIMSSDVGDPTRMPACEQASRRLNSAFKEIDSGAASNIKLYNPLRQQWVRTRQLYIIHACLRACKALRYEPALISKLSLYNKAIKRRLNSLNGMRSSSCAR